ncbi:hypothetical protein DUI87_31212 [Hirundo rustica rustica]|uniref:ribonuclease H n=1 Tax=Hirundo rustica rustica TaxID=333673 RepID=A0A3M0IV59_HIRRU|nr:hypothetical protein DUI87_31212 [Hirundo rustica rustica]
MVRTLRHGLGLEKSLKKSLGVALPLVEAVSNSLLGEKRITPAHPRSPLQVADRQLRAFTIPGGEFQLWEAAWRQLLKEALPGLLIDLETAVDEEGNALTLDHLVADSRHPPYRLRLTEGLHLRTADWTIASVNAEEQGTWPVVEVPTINREAPRRHFHWRVLPQGMKNSPVICQWYVASLLSPVRAAADKAIIHRYMDDVLVCAPNDDVLSHALDLTINSLIAAGFELQEEKVQRMPPWRYLGLEISKRTIVQQKLEIRTKVSTLADLHQLCGALNWVRPWLGLTTEDLVPLFDLLKGGEDLSSPRVLTPEGKKALERVQDCMSTRQAHRYDPGLPFKFIIMGRLPHLHGVIFQWRDIPKKD